MKSDDLQLLGPLAPVMELCLRHLFDAFEAAPRFQLSSWDFAVELQILQTAGVDHNTLRGLVSQGLIQHAVETTRLGAKQRTFRESPNLRLVNASCFVLSAMGLELCEQLRARWHLPAAIVSHVAVPKWDSDRAELRLGDVVVKRFRQPAKNQRAILDAFQGENWAPRIDNPLPEEDQQPAQDRLHDAVRRLNQQIHTLIRFESDGSGEGVLWRLIPQAPRSAVAAPLENVSQSIMVPPQAGGNKLAHMP